MKFAKKLTATIAVCASVTFAGAGVSSAKVFHGHWIGGRIEEAYHRLGGWQTFGDATTDERVAKMGLPANRGHVVELPSG